MRLDGALQSLDYTITTRVLCSQRSHRAVCRLCTDDVAVLTDWPDLLNPNLDALDDHDTSSLDTLTSKQSRRKEKGAQLVHTAADAVSSENASTSVTEQPLTVTDTPQPGAAELEDEAESEGAFNPETGEINWDCPCLGGMAHGPCGPQFREAFSCFVYSSEEPKGMDCIEKFQGMRDCFHEHPDVYKDEIMDDEDIDRELEVERETEQQGLTDKIAARQKADNDSGRRLLEEAAPEPKPSKTTRAPSDESKRPSQKTSKSSSASQSTVHSVSEVPAVEPIPPSAHDARGEVAES